MFDIMDTFKHTAFGQVRAVACEGEPWFMASDIAKVLGYREADKLTRRLDSDEMTTPLKTGSLSKIRGLRKDTRFINESGLYTAILCSNKPEAKRFRKWITSEVLPSIRKHGGYLTPQTIEEALRDPDTLIQLVTELKQEREARLELEGKVVAGKL